MCKTETYRLELQVSEQENGCFAVQIRNGGNVVTDLPLKFPSVTDAVSGALFRLSCDVSFYHIGLEAEPS